MQDDEKWHGMSDWMYYIALGFGVVLSLDAIWKLLRVLFEMLAE